jgi:hypothetical protein
MTYTSGDWAQIHLKVVVCVDCVPLYWKFKIMLNEMWGAPCSQQGSALTCLILRDPILQMLHLEMSSYDIHKNLWPSGANRWVVCVRVLWRFATSCAGHFIFPGCNYKQSTDHAILYVSLFLKTRSGNLTLWSCELPVHCKPRDWWCLFHDIWINASLQWFFVTTRYNHFICNFSP